MSRTTAPLLSFDARGQIAKTQVYASWKGRSYARRYVIPANPRTADQVETRNTFSWLNAVWRYMPAGAIDAWNVYADNNRFTNRNGFVKQNLSQLRDQPDLSGIILSPSANGGLVATDATATAGSGQITASLTAPDLPNGWTIIAAHALAIRQQDPQDGTFYELAYDTVANPGPYDIVLSGLETEEYVVGMWFSFAKSPTENAYGLALTDNATPTA